MITETNAVANKTVQTQSGTQSQPSGLTSDFETFLKMLTAQARNQDPLEPLDSSEYASQLAQFSMVEQQVQTNDLLSGLSSVLNRVNFDEMSRWVGMDVRNSESLRFEGKPRTIFTEPHPNATRAELVIRNAQGTEVDRIAVPVANQQILWDGLNNAGTPLPVGNYFATLESYESGKLLSSNPAAAYSRVIEVQASDGDVLLTLDTGFAIPATDVKAVRASS